MIAPPAPAATRFSPVAATLLAPLLLAVPPALAFVGVRWLSAASGGMSPARGIPLFLGLVLGLGLAGGAAWGRMMAGVAGGKDAAGAARRCGAAFGAGSLFAATSLMLAAQELQRRVGPHDPRTVHSVFTLLHTVAVCVVAGAASATLGASLQAGEEFRPQATRAAAAAGIAALVSDVLMYVLGWRIGAYDAAARASMPTVLAVGCVMAAVVGTAMLAHALAPAARPGRRRAA